MGRAPCCEKNNGLKKGPWTPEEDQKLVDYIHKHGYGNWRLLPKNAGLQRCGKSCRLRWTNYLRPDIKRGRFSFEEEEAIIQLHSILGNKWSAIASRLPGRTDNEIKNYWNTHIRKRLLKMGIDPVTHSPRLDLLDISSVLNSSLYGSSQMNLQSEILKLASSLFSSHSHQRQDQNICAQNGQENQLCNTQLQNQQISHLVQNQDSVGEVCSTLLNPPFTQTQLVESNSNMNPSIFNEFGIQQAQLSDWHCNGFASSNVTEDYYYVPQLPSYFETESDYHPNDIVDPTLSETSTFQSNNSNQNFSFASVLSTTPSSSPTPLNSNSTYINGEDETESYVSSNNMFRFQISDILGVNEFM